MKKILEKFIKFVMVSGIGWVIDFGLYIFLTKFLDFNILGANFVSSIPAITFVFLISTKKIFDNMNSKKSLTFRYLLYASYQFILILVVSFIGEFIFDFIKTFSEFTLNYGKVIAKVLITPITMISNFIVMKFLIEKKVRL